MWKIGIGPRIIQETLKYGKITAPDGIYVELFKLINVRIINRLINIFEINSHPENIECQKCREHRIISLIIMN